MDWVLIVVTTATLGGLLSWYFLRRLPQKSMTILAATVVISSSIYTFLTKGTDTPTFWFHIALVAIVVVVGLTRRFKTT
jgi:hypothetical protein